MVGADRLYVQPLRRPHRERAPHGGSAQPHLVHRRAAAVPGDAHGTAPGGAEQGAPARGPGGTRLLVLGGRAVTEGPAAMEWDARGPQLRGQPRGRVATCRAPRRRLGGWGALRSVWSTLTGVRPASPLAALGQPGPASRRGPRTLGGSGTARTAVASAQRARAGRGPGLSVPPRRARSRVCPACGFGMTRAWKPHTSSPPAGPHFATWLSHAPKCPVRWDRALGWGDIKCLEKVVPPKTWQPLPGQLASRHRYHRHGIRGRVRAGDPAGQSLLMGI